VRTTAAASGRDGAVTLTGCTIDGNIGGEYGGGVFSGSGNVTVTASTFSGNGNWYVTGGGGISAGGMLAVDSTISGNAASAVPASEQRHADADPQRGGRQPVVLRRRRHHVLAGAATVTDSTISNNSVRYNGAGMYVVGTLTASNSTIARQSRLSQWWWHRTGRQRNAASRPCDAGAERRRGTEWRHRLLHRHSWTGSATIDHSIVSGNTQGAAATSISAAHGAATAT
jgi:hypothetical protein